MRSSRRGTSACNTCGLILPGRLPVPFHARTSWTGSAPLQRCEGKMATPSYALHEAAKRLRVTWIADHVDAVLAQTLASRAYRALNRVCLGQARRVRGV